MKAIILLLALTASAFSGNLVAWGWNLYGQSDIPVEVSVANIVALGLGSSSNHNLVMTSDGDLLAWGWNLYGQCNVPEYPVDFGNSLSTTENTSLSVMSNGTVKE